MSSEVSPVVERIGTARILPVVVVDDATEALAVAGALRDGGLPVAEITLRTAGALGAIEAIAAEFPEVLVGAGTIVDASQVDDAVAAGARFLVSPGLSADVVRRARHHGVPIVPGVATASDIMAALGLGLTDLKLFPAGVLGGPAAVKALAAPFPGVRFTPTGGVSATTAPDYLSLPAVRAVGGSWMVDRSLVRAGDWAQITRRTRAAVALAARSSLATVAGA